MRNTNFAATHTHYAGQLLDALMYRLSPEDRAVLMGELPAAYNAYVGGEVVQVVRRADLACTVADARPVANYPRTFNPTFPE